MMKPLNLPSYSFKIKSKEQKKYIFDAIRKKFVLLTPEEWVRQNFIRYLIEQKGCSPSLIAVEQNMNYNRLNYRADVVIYNRRAQPVLLVECKAPDVPVTQDHFDQIARYNIRLKVQYLIVTNGMEHYCCKVDFENQQIQFMKTIPHFKELQDRE